MLKNQMLNRSEWLWILMVVTGLSLCAMKAYAQDQNISDEEAARLYQIDADKARLEHLIYWTQQIERYHRETGHYPLQDKINESETAIVRIATPLQQEYFNPESESYRKDLDYNQPNSKTGKKRFEEFSVSEFVYSLEDQFKHGIRELYDIQKAPTASPIWYNYFVTKDGYLFYVTCKTCGVTQMSTLLFDGITPTVNIASKGMVDKVTKAFERKEMLTSSTFRLWMRRGFIKERFVRSVERENYYHTNPKISLYEKTGEPPIIYDMGKHADDKPNGRERSESQQKEKILNDQEGLNEQTGMQPWKVVLEGKTPEHKRILQILKNLNAPFNEVFNPERDLAAEIEEIIFLWAGASNVEPDSRGPHIDARRLRFLEEIAGREFVQLGAMGVPNPLYFGAKDLKVGYLIAYNSIFADIINQAIHGVLFTGEPKYDPSLSLYSGVEGLNTEALETLISNSNASNDFSKKEQMWKSVVRAVEHSVGIQKFSDNDITSLNEAIEVSLPGHNLSSIIRDVSIYELEESYWKYIISDRIYKFTRKRFSPLTINSLFFMVIIIGFMLIASKRKKA